MDGAELADGISMNPREWFLTNIDCCCFWVNQFCLLVDSLSSESEIMGYTSSDSNRAVNYKDW